MALSPELKLMVSGAQAKYQETADPLEAKRAEIRAGQNAEREADGYDPSIREQLAWLGFSKATKRELRDIILKAMERDPDA